MLYLGLSFLISVFSRISASASERVAVVSIAATCCSISMMRGLWPLFWKYDETRFFRFFALPT
jgi:hypothetical protein